ncbi:MAG: hypothetical protein Fur0040_09750 [Sideroxydans sp.]
MSEFQLSLLAVGTVVVVAVWLYGVWQQWRYRRSLTRAARESAAPASAAMTPADAAPAVAAAPQHYIAAADAEMADIDPRIHYIVSMELKFPLTSAALEGYWQRRFDYGKTTQAVGCNAISGAWERLIPDSPVSYSAFKVGLQLVDRSGMVSETRLADFRELLGEIGCKLEANMVLPMVDAALERARELDKFCAEVDRVIGINLLIPSDRVLFASEVARVVGPMGMSLQADGSFHQFAADGATLFTLAAADGTPFQHHTLDQTRVSSLTLLLDIPRVAQPERRFDEMTLLAMELAAMLHASLIDDQRVVLGQAALAQIRTQVEAVARRMTAAGIEPGSELALRLFS